jgi:Protein of unknown function (DUF3551)
MFNSAWGGIGWRFANMKITRPLLAVLTLTVLAPIDATPANAETYCRPWCVHYSGGGRGGGTNCGFTSFEQCMWTAQGSDVCLVNQLCPPQGSRGGWQGYDDRRRR